MENKDLTLFFFIIYDFIITLLFFYIWWNTRKRSEDKDKYIDELLFELEKARKK